MKHRHVITLITTLGLVILLVLAFVLPGCGGTEETTVTAAAQPATSTMQAQTTTTKAATTTTQLVTTTTQGVTTTEAATATTVALPAPTVSGTIAFAKVTDVGGVGCGDIWVINSDGSGLRQLTATSDASENELAWSPDGTKIAYSGGDPTTWDYTLRVVNADGSGSGPLTGKVMPGACPSWSPDGSRIAFSVFEGLAAHVEVMNADGGGVQAATSGPGTGVFPTWLPDGTLLFLNITIPSRGDIYRVTADGSGLTAVTTGDYVSFYALSPDEKELVIHDTLGDRLVLLPVSGQGNPTVLVDKVSRYIPNFAEANTRASLSWSPDGRAIAFAASLMNNPPGGSSLYVVNADGSGLSMVPKAEHVADVCWRP